MILFQNREYPTRQIKLPEFGDVLISTCSLNSKLMREDGAYVSTEATIIDEMICYFVEDNQILLPDKSLLELLKSELN